MLLVLNLQLRTKVAPDDVLYTDLKECCTQFGSGWRGRGFAFSERIPALLQNRYRAQGEYPAPSTVKYPLERGYSVLSVSISEYLVGTRRILSDGTVPLEMLPFCLEKIYIGGGVTNRSGTGFLVFMLCDSILGERSELHRKCTDLWDLASPGMFHSWFGAGSSVLPFGVVWNERSDDGVGSAVKCGGVAP